MEDDFDFITTPICKLKDSKFLFIDGDKYEILSFNKWEMGYEIEIKRCDN